MKLVLGGSVWGRPYGRATGIGAFWENVVGRPFWTMGFEPALVRWPPLRLARLRLERVVRHVRVDGEEDRLDEEGVLLERERDAEYLPERGHEVRPQESELERQDRPRDDPIAKRISATFDQRFARALNAGLPVRR